MEMPLIEQVRSFNRTMTERVGVLTDHFLGPNHPLGEARLLWEIRPTPHRGFDCRSE
jgi:hypothetical protein